MSRYTTEWGKEDWGPGIGRRTNNASGAVVWCARLDARSPSKTFPRKGDAQRWRRDQLKLKDTGVRVTTDHRTFGQYVAGWLELKGQGAVVDRKGKARVVGLRTLTDYRLLARDWIAPAKRLQGTPMANVGSTRIGKVTYETLNALYRCMQTRTTVGTIVSLHRFLGQAFVELERKGVMPRNPCDLANVPQRPAVDRTAREDDEDEDVGGADASSASMTEGEARAFLDAARRLADADDVERQDPASGKATVRLIPERCWSARWHVGLGCGLRPEEVEGLQWRDVELDGKEPALTVRRVVVRVTGTKGYTLAKPKTRAGRRRIPLAPEVATELRAWRKMQQRSGMASLFVFTTTKGTPLADHRRSYVRVCSEAALGTWGPEPVRKSKTGPLPTREFTPRYRIYDLRHTFVTLLLMHGTPVNVVRELAGHETAAFTLTRYGHALPRQTKEAAVTIGALLFKRPA